MYQVLTIYRGCKPLIDNLYPCTSPANINAPPDWFGMLFAMIEMKRKFSDKEI